MVFEYEAISNNGEEYDDTGTIVAENEDEAREELWKMGFREIRVKRVRGFKAFLKTLTANTK